MNPILKVVLVTVVLYISLCALVKHSLYTQTLLTFHHWVRLPLGDLTDLNALGLAQDTRNIVVTTQDGVELKGYHLLPAGEVAVHAAGYALEGDDAALREAYFDDMLMEAERVFVYFHGTAATRAFNNRIPLIRRLASHFNAHVISIDYRGFGDSGGFPSETGTALDSRATVEWVRARLTPAQTRLDRHDLSPAAILTPIYIYGQSLGTGIAAELVANEPGLHLAGLILDAPFTELREAALTHPAGAPLRIIPWIRDDLFDSFMIKYDTLALVPLLKHTHVMLLHGQADWKVLPSNSRKLFQAALGMEVTGESLVKDTTLNGRAVRVESQDGLMSIVEIPGAGHDNVYTFPAWLSQLDNFISKAEGTGKFSVVDLDHTKDADRDVPQRHEAAAMERWSSWSYMFVEHLWTQLRCLVYDSSSPDCTAVVVSGGTRSSSFYDEAYDL